MAETGCEATEAVENEQFSREIPALAEGYSSFDGEEDNPLPKKSKTKKSKKQKKAKKSRVEVDSNSSSCSGSEQSSVLEDPSAYGSEPDSDQK